MAQSRIIASTGIASIKQSDVQSDVKVSGDISLQDSLIRRVYESRVPNFFEVAMSAGASNVTGDGTVYKPTFDVENENADGLFDLDNNRFFVLSDGLYELSIKITCAGITSSAKTAGAIGFTVSGTSIMTIYREVNFAQNEITEEFRALARLSYADIVQAAVYFDGGSKDVGVVATRGFIGAIGGTVRMTIFRGQKISS